MSLLYLPRLWIQNEELLGTCHISLYCTLCTLLIVAVRLVENAVAYIREVTISPSGAADRIIALCTQSVAESAADAIGDEDSTPGLESFLWNFWDTVINDIVFRESELHDRLVEILKWMKKRGRAGCRNWKVWGEDMDWTNLVLFGPNLRENFNGGRYPRADALPWPEVYRILSGDTPSDLNNPLSTAYSDARTHWLNLCRFIMRLWAEDVSDFEVYGIWMMRAGLEDLDLSHPEDTSKEPSTTMAVTITLGIEEAGVCVQAAGAKMYKSSTIFGPHGNPDWKQSNAPGRGGIRWKGVDGYHTERWKLWKALFKEVIDAETTLRPRAIDAAKVR
ncbi:hypothetical protein PHLGIDRAFT_492550 [Phlebiopsis gigantea 11061_1 CR5-6]|uniref:Uncharacterized protein n=1 Tax=Phlebiopsis gigantea (strain 11061_1 CR5-6) TaxID=745531 RepID=A0A0C3NZJ1_PHLG1|nr:hypothetical protein PHLGIDRAFT_492550 [Phlebiopsis gigantea 11061_1 CR5-6]